MITYATPTCRMPFPRYQHPPTTPALKHAVTELSRPDASFDALQVMLTALSQTTGVMLNWRTHLPLVELSWLPGPAHATLEEHCVAHWDLFCAHMATLPFSPALGAVAIISANHHPHLPAVPPHYADAIRFFSHPDICEYEIPYIQACVARLLPDDLLTLLIDAHQFPRFLSPHCLATTDYVLLIQRALALHRLPTLLPQLLSFCTPHIWGMVCRDLYAAGLAETVRPVIATLSPSFRVATLTVADPTLDDLRIGLRALGSLSANPLETYPARPLTPDLWARLSPPVLLQALTHLYHVEPPDTPLTTQGPEQTRITAAIITVGLKKHQSGLLHQFQQAKARHDRLVTHQIDLDTWLPAKLNACLPDREDPRARLDFLRRLLQWIDADPNPRTQLGATFLEFFDRWVATNGQALDQTHEQSLTKTLHQCDPSFLHRPVDHPIA